MAGPRAILLRTASGVRPILPATLAMSNSSYPASMTFVPLCTGQGTGPDRTYPKNWDAGLKKNEDM